MADNDPQSPRDLSRFAEDLLQQMDDHFQMLANKLALQNMGERIDDLEKHINGLLAQAGVENASEELTVLNYGIRLGSLGKVLNELPEFNMVQKKD